MAKQPSQKEGTAPLSANEKLTRIAEFQFPSYNWRHKFGAGCIPGEEHDEAATRVVMPDYSDPKVILDLVKASGFDFKVEYPRALYRIVKGHDVTEEDDGSPLVDSVAWQRIDAFLEAVSKR